MAYSLENTTDLTALANAIRAKTGDNATMTVSAMATAVAGISGGGSSWTPTTMTDITNNAIVSLSKNNGSIDLSGYTSVPYILVGYIESRDHSYTTTIEICIYSGSIIVGEAGANSSIYYVNLTDNVLSFSTMDPASQCKFYLIT